MKLTGQNVQQICDALIAAYPTRDLLRMMVRVELDRNLEEIAGGENQNVVVFNLVSWAERNGRVDELIERAHLRTPGNAALSRLAADWHAQTSFHLVPEDFVAMSGLVEREAVDDDVAGVDLALLDPIEQRARVMLDVRLPRLDRQPAVHDTAHRHLVDEAALGAGDRDGAAFAAGLERRAQGGRPSFP